MPEIHVLDGRLFSTDGAGFVVREDELALLEAGDGVALSISGSVTGGSDDTASITLTPDSRLRVDTRPSLDDRNLFAGSAWAGQPQIFAGPSAW